MINIMRFFIGIVLLQIFFMPISAIALTEEGGALIYHRTIRGSTFGFALDVGSENFDYGQIFEGETGISPQAPSFTYAFHLIFPLSGDFEILPGISYNSGGSYRNALGEKVNFNSMTILLDLKYKYSFLFIGGGLNMPFWHLQMDVSPFIDPFDDVSFYGRTGYQGFIGARFGSGYLEIGYMRINGLIAGPDFEIVQFTNGTYFKLGLLTEF